MYGSINKLCLTALHNSARLPSLFFTFLYRIAKASAGVDLWLKDTIALAKRHFVSRQFDDNYIKFSPPDLLPSLPTMASFNSKCINFQLKADIERFPRAES